MRPFLNSVSSLAGEWGRGPYPFSVPAFRQGINIQFNSLVTFFVGANGSGKSTLLEAIADKCGFNLGGGNRNHLYEMPDVQSALTPVLRLGWMPKVTDGFFLRAETFFNFGSYIDGLNNSGLLFHEDRNSVHDQSHGEAFLALFNNRFRRGIYILDEPEAALSPTSQLTFMSVLHRLCRGGSAQFLIATHSPMLICYPGAEVLTLTDDGIESVDYHETEHYKVTKGFLDCPERYFRHLFADGD